MRSLNGNNLTDGGKDMSGVLKLAEAAKQSKLERLRLRDNGLYTNKLREAVREAAGPGVGLEL